MDICIYIYVYVYYELIVFLYVGANTFWIFDFSVIFAVPQTVDFVFFVDLC